MFYHITEHLARPAAGNSRGGAESDRGGPTTQGGLAIRSELDEAAYPTGRAVTDEEMDRLSIKRDVYFSESP